MPIIVSIPLPKLHDHEVSEGIYLIGEPIPRPDLGDNRMACLANVCGVLALIELIVKPVEAHS
jgi:hypothetical protein